MSYILIGLGGASGAIMRVFLAKALPSKMFEIPLPILLINILGCFIIGLITEALPIDSSEFRNIKSFFISGLLGGFTTFSTFALEFGTLIEKNLYVPAIAYATLSFTLSITFFFIGLKIVRIFL